MFRPSSLLQNPVAASRQSAANRPFSGNESRPLPRRRYASKILKKPPSRMPFRSWGLLGALLLGFCSFLCARTTHAQSPASSGTVITIAGNGNAGFSGDGGPAINATLNGPYGLAIGPDGTLYFADSSNYRIRAIAPATGIITTLAGNGTPGDTGDGGPATNAALGGVLSVAVDRARHALYLADLSNNRVRKVNLTTGIMSSFAGMGLFGFGFSGDGGPATSAMLALPEGVATDGTGKLSIADVFNNRIRQVDPVTGIITTLAGNGNTVSAGDGGLATAASFASPRRVTADSAGNVFVLDVDASNANRIRRIDAATGIITTVAGGGTSVPGTGPATNMNLSDVSDLVVSDAGTLFIASSTRVFLVDLATGQLTPFAGDGIEGFSGDGGPALNARFNRIASLTLAPGGGLLISSWGDARIRAVVPPPPLPIDLIVELTTSQAILDLVNSVEGSVLMISVGGRDLLVVPNMASVGLDVTVTGNDQLLVIDLGALESVGGSINISGNLAMTSLDLSALTTVGGDLTLTNNPSLSAILVSGVVSIGGDLTIIGTAATVINMASLVTVSGSLDISGNQSATAIDMASLTTVGGTLTIDDNTAANPINMAALTSSGELSISGNTAADAIDMGSLVSTSGGLTIDGNTSALIIDMSSATTVSGSLIISGNTSAAAVDMSALVTVAGALDISGNISAGELDLGALTDVGGAINMADNAAAGVLDLSGLVSAGSLEITGNTSATVIDMASLTTVSGDLVIENNGEAAVNMSSGTTVGGDLSIETTGTGTFPMGDGVVAGELSLDTTGYTEVSGTTGGGDTNLTAATLDAVMRLRIRSASFAAPVSFSVTHLDPVALVPESGVAADGGPAAIDPVVGYQFAFTTPVLNRDATLSFDVDVGALDAASQAELLAALASGTATMVTKSDAPGSLFQAFDICTGAAVPTVDGCVGVETLDASGAPTTGTPAIVRFSNVVGHFSTWAVAVVAPGDTDGDGVSDADERRAGTDPNNAASVFRIVALQPEAGGVRITWSTVGGKSYVVQTNAAPAGGSFTHNFADFSPLIPVSGPGESTTNVLDPGAITNVPARYYLIRLGP